MSPRIFEAYWGWTRQFILFHGKRHPETMGKGSKDRVTLLPRGRR